MKGKWFKNVDRFSKSLGTKTIIAEKFKDEKTIIADMTKSMVKPRNILLTLKEHNVNSYTTIIKQKIKLNCLM